MLKGTITTLALLLCSLFVVAATSNEKKYNELYAQYLQYYNEQDYLKSIKCLEEALQYAHKDSLSMYSDAYAGICWAYSNIGKSEIALDYAQKALEMDMKIGNATNISTTLAQISSIFVHQKQYAEAERYMLKAIEYQLKDHSKEANYNLSDSIAYFIEYKNANTTERLANRYATLGEILTFEKRYDEAIEKIQYAYTLDTIDHRMNKAAIRLSQLGNVYIEMSDYEKANEILSQTTVSLRETNNRKSLCISLIQLAKAQMELGMRELAEQSAVECLSLSDNSGQMKTKYESMRLLSYIRKSPILYEQTAKLRDTLYNEQIQSQIAEFEVKYNLSEKERENAELQITVERQHHIMTLLTILVIAFLIGGALTFSIYKMRLNIQHTELVARKLFFGKSKVDDEQTATAEPTTPVEENVPLSPREMDILKACCQGKLSKEIADELFISKRTVDAHKSTIYQKLGVSNNTELILYAAKHGMVNL